MADLAAQTGEEQRFLTFRIDADRYALPADEVLEIIRLPAFARVPQSPKSLLGLANLRGAVIPLASVRALLGRPEAATAGDRAIVLEGAAPVALAVDAVEALVTLDSGHIETQRAPLAARAGERLRGAFQAGEGQEATKILDVKALLEADFSPRARPAQPAQRSGPLKIDRGAGEERSSQRMLVTFEVAGQEFALPMAAVQEVLSAPRDVAKMPRAEALVVGVEAFRGGLLPLLSLRGLLGFPEADDRRGQEKVVVTSVGGAAVGLVVDRMMSVLGAEAQAIDPTPPVLAARAGGESLIKAIFRAEGGRRLVSILEPERLFREDIMQRLAAAPPPGASREDAGQGSEGADAQFLVFRLDSEEFGLPIAAVDEVARVPEQTTRVPKAPKFLEGVINLRGEVLPVVDQRRRFELPPFPGARQQQRLVVVRSGGRRAGLIVDSVSEVLRTRFDRIEPAPDLTGDSAPLVHGVINLETSGRVILLLEPEELLTRAERRLLERFEAKEAHGPS
jgi:purine-binding chemotaxis protein CheW